MNFIKVHNNNELHLVNLRAVSCIFSECEGSKICFDGNEYIIADESVDEIAAMIQQAEEVKP